MGIVAMCYYLLKEEVTVKVKMKAEGQPSVMIFDFKILFWKDFKTFYSLLKVNRAKARAWDKWAKLKKKFGIKS